MVGKLEPGPIGVPGAAGKPTLSDEFADSVEPDRPGELCEPAKPCEPDEPCEPRMPSDPGGCPGGCIADGAAVPAGPGVEPSRLGVGASSGFEVAAPLLADPAALVWFCIFLSGGAVSMDAVKTPNTRKPTTNRPAAIR
jgi:hypothetical protein